MNTRLLTMGRRRRAAATLSVLLALALLAGCASKGSVTPNFYRFDTGWLDRLPAPAPASGNAPAPGTPAPASAPTADLPARQPTLIVNPVQAAAGYDSAHIVYQREPSHQQRFAYNEWVDTPARLLTPALMTALARSGHFAAVVATPSAAAGDLRLDVEIVQLLQDFRQQPSRVRLALHAYLVDDTTRRVLAWRDIRAEAAAPSDDPVGGVAAASQAVREALQQLSAFAGEAARDWKPTPLPMTTGRTPAR